MWYICTGQEATTSRKFWLLLHGVGATDLHCVSKNTPTLASYNFDSQGLVLIIFGQQHQHIFKNDMHIQLSLSLYFYLLYLLLNSSDGNDARIRVFFGRLLVALKRTGYVVCCVGSDKSQHTTPKLVCFFETQCISVAPTPCSSNQIFL